MSSLPFEVHEVLEQEYVSMHGPLEVPPPEYGPDDIIDEAWALKILDDCGMTKGTACPDDVKELAARRAAPNAPTQDVIEAATRTLELVSAL
ncbi:MAG: hypothetical protein QOE82_887, partial [Thermoanaerobaculia bacterium]|nr:hypothetical protein [Thermoanaerobaculia bacterium]